MASGENLIGITIAILSISLSGLPFVFSALYSGRYQKSITSKCSQREFDFVSRNGVDNLSNLSGILPGKGVVNSTLLMESVVVGASWWQSFVGFLHSLFGGKIDSFDSVLSFARLESMQRLREKAEREGYDTVVNMRIETSSMVAQTNSKSKVAGVEVLVYGTGIRYAK